MLIHIGKYPVRHERSKAALRQRVSVGDVVLRAVPYISMKLERDVLSMIRPMKGMSQQRMVRDGV